jgi:hypothetical protein
LTFSQKKRTFSRRAESHKFFDTDDQCDWLDLHELLDAPRRCYFSGHSKSKAVNSHKNGDVWIVLYAGWPMKFPQRELTVLDQASQFASLADAEFEVARAYLDPAHCRIEHLSDVIKRQKI